MIQKYSRYKVLQVFFKKPLTLFHIREIGRIVTLSQPSVKLHLDALEKEKLIVRSEEGLYGGYKANRDNEEFRFLKILNTLLILHQSRLVDYLYDQIQPQVIILFGSASKGEDVEQSDIDIFIEAEEMDFILKKYEKLFNRKINVYFQKNFKELSKEFKNNLINGIVLKGFLKL
jgi:predicted nucleotidyltransferase